jgi:redox-sensing transcriptional repressor
MMSFSQTKRLLRYRMGLLRLQNMGMKKVFSYSIGEETGVTPELVRKDFSKFGIKGRRRGGYEVKELLIALDKIFGKEKVQNVIIVGMGNMGKALSSYKGFSEYQMNIVAGFDIDQSKLEKKFDIPVYSVNYLPDVIEAFSVSVAILAVPENAAQQVTDSLVYNGITGILNLVPVLLKVPENVWVNNVNIMVELERLMYHSGVLK